ncbi:MAG: cation:proton antiporter [Nitrososphaerota archaeon]
MMSVSSMDPIMRAIVTISVLVFFAKVLGGVFSSFKLPSIIGELLAGIILGPSMLGTAIVIFGEPLVVLNEFVEAFAEIGAIMILFSAGLEMGATSLRRAGIWAFIVASGGALLPFIGGYYFYSWLGYPEGSALMTGAIMVATSLAITVRVMEDFGALGTDESILLLNAAVVDDVIGVSILAVVSSALSAPQGRLDLMSALRTTSIFFITWFLMLIVGVYVIPRFIERALLIKAEGAVEAAAIGSAFIMSAIAAGLGLSPIIGSYAAGLSVAESKALVRVKDFIKHLNQVFSPLFFTFVGARMDVTLFSENVMLGLLILTGIAFATKFLGSALTSLPKLRNWIKAVRVGVGMVPRGELGLVIASLGLSRGLISQTIYIQAVGMVILTSFITPIILSRLYRETT